ncbi:MAG: ATP-binding cassette domain-containing protein [Kiritimatiellae bacterium]|nr:ATP-binding cassette domain-containing protein [Kiritimatiellia bacterium]
MSETLLEVKNLSCGYGDRPVLNGVDLAVREGESVLLAGPNGCGKSTFLKAVIGALPLTDGEVAFGGEPLAGKSVEERVHLGIGYLRQTDNIFPGQTVEENLMLAGMSLAKTEYAAARDGMLELFEFLKPKLGQRAGSLSGGQRQALALAMVFMRPQRLYLLDEPTAGLSPKAAQDIMERVHRFAKDGANRAILMVEHRLDLLAWIDRAVFLSQGRVKSETSDSRQFLDANWLAKNYFE